MGLACQGADGRFTPTEAGIARHRQEILHQPA
jgi:hypothetical protein